MEGIENVDLYIYIWTTITELLTNSLENVAQIVKIPNVGRGYYMVSIQLLANMKKVENVVMIIEIPIIAKYRYIEVTPKPEYFQVFMLPFFFNRNCFFFNRHCLFFNRQRDGHRKINIKFCTDQGYLEPTEWQIYPYLNDGLVVTLISYNYQKLISFGNGSFYWGIQQILSILQSWPNSDKNTI